MTSEATSVTILVCHGLVDVAHFNQLQWIATTGNCTRTRGGSQGKRGLCPLSSRVSMSIVVVGIGCIGCIGSSPDQLIARGLVRHRDIRYDSGRVKVVRKRGPAVK